MIYFTWPLKKNTPRTQGGLARDLTLEVKKGKLDSTLERLKKDYPLTYEGHGFGDFDVNSFLKHYRVYSDGNGSKDLVNYVEYIVGRIAEYSKAKKLYPWDIDSKSGEFNLEEVKNKLHLVLKEMCEKR